MTIEICTDSLEGAILAETFGAKRIELCAALSVGGLTPNYGLIHDCVEKNVEVHVMIRHKEGGFIYSNSDVIIMKKDIEKAKEAGANGVVFGCLTKNNEIDTAQNHELVAFAKSLSLEVTFHRAFDFVSNFSKALEELIALKFDRILTSGTKPTAFEGKEIIEQIVKQAQNRIEIMAGSGINSINVQEIATTGVNAIHFTSHRKDANNSKLGMGSLNIPDPKKISAISSVLSNND